MECRPHPQQRASRDREKTAKGSESVRKPVSAATQKQSSNSEGSCKDDRIHAHDQARPACFNCGKQGHIARTCRQKANNPMSATGNQVRDLAHREAGARDAVSEAKRETKDLEVELEKVRKEKEELVDRADRLSEALEEHRVVTDAELAMRRIGVSTTWHDKDETVILETYKDSTFREWHVFVPIAITSLLFLIFAKSHFYVSTFLALGGLYLLSMGIYDLCALWRLLSDEHNPSFWKGDLMHRMTVVEIRNGHGDRRPDIFNNSKLEHRDSLYVKIVVHSRKILGLKWMEESKLFFRAARFVGAYEVLYGPWVQKSTLWVSAEFVAQLSNPQYHNHNSNYATVYDRLNYAVGGLGTVNFDRYEWMEGCDFPQSSALVSYWVFKSSHQKRLFLDFPRTSAQ